MENHPVPQNITSYEFRLVGDMTLKQFFYLAFGIVLAFVFFRLPVIGIIKYPLALLSILIGFLMAFIPVNGRPFSAWMSAFVKAIYAPTEFFWVPDSSPPPIIPIPTPITVTASVPPTTPAKEAATSTMTVPPAPVPAPFTPIATSKIPQVTPVTTQTTDAVGTRPPTPPVPPPPPAPPPAPASPSVQKLAPPPPTPISAPKFTSPPPLPQTAGVSSAPSAAVTSMISPPTSPNILAGLVTDPQNQPLANTTVEIIDTSTGIPARALRTNKLGQFQIAIPLPAGSYNVIVEKENFTFDPVSITVKGAIVPPVIIQGKNA